MKKFLLFISLSLVATLGSAQVIFNVQAPSSNAGNYNMSYAQASSGWGVPDMTDPANAITGQLCMASDGTSADSLVCNAVTNNVTGKIACLYRGSCEFGVKALNCQNAGAIGVIIINNVPGAPIQMGGGAQGTNVTIPVVMISDIDGATLKADMEACNTTTAFIGSKTGYYGSDLGFYPEHILRPEQFGNVQALSQDASEFEVQLGGWVINYGANDQTNVTLNAVVDNGSVLYDNTSTPEALILPGDSVFVVLPTFSQASYPNGYYDITYTIASDSTDEFPNDNTLAADFLMSDSLYSYSRLDAGNGSPIALNYYRASNSTATNSSCMAFRDPNASRIAINGMTFSATTLSANSLDGEFVQAFAYEWNDNFTDLNDPNFAISNLVEITSGDYIYNADLQGDSIFISFDEPMLLTDNQRYLFCITHYGEFIFTGYDTEIDYNWNLETYLQPQFPGESDGSWFATGFGTDIVPAISLNVFPSAVGIDEEESDNEIVAYPNPANVVVNIPVGENYGAVTLTITDMQGRVVSTQNIQMASPILTVDISELSSGSYIFNILHGDENETITVSVAK
ncbi:MAG: T9SS type A sorting domain-containing protein [Crocinitomicaceae bacterium]|nr:T9SS type A sorting domain-containing protein [Crocinitomicaceae bacterium]